jgi:hypothetical protein
MDMTKNRVSQAFSRIGYDASIRHALVHHNPRNFQPEPFGEFFHAHSKLLELKSA